MGGGWCHGHDVYLGATNHSLKKIEANCMDGLIFEELSSLLSVCSLSSFVVVANVQGRVTLNNGQQSSPKIHYNISVYININRE